MKATPPPTSTAAWRAFVAADLQRMMDEACASNEWRLYVEDEPEPDEI